MRWRRPALSRLLPNSSWYATRSGFSPPCRSCAAASSSARRCPTNTRRAFHDYLFIGEEETYLYQNGKLYAGGETVFEGGASALEAQNAEFLAAIQDGSPSSVTAEAVMPAMRILQAVQDQNQTLRL